MKQVSDMVGEIASASEEQSRGIEQLNQAAVQMDELTQRNAALVAETATAAKSLEEQPTKSKDFVASFKFSSDSSSMQKIAQEQRPQLSVRKASAEPALTKEGRSTVTATVIGTIKPARRIGANGWETF
ncbi:hypothetical protein [Paraburkholderia diazotrophica]|uniref:hypothetical protein n=1 Tax=Paraburkholderia diazotrophica TaxID=667676 RepID=UPI0031715534